MILNLKIYIVFHKDYDTNIYNIIPKNNKYLTFYGVKTKKDSQYNQIYEFEMPINTNFFQNNKYNEASALYHLFINKTYQNNDWIGLFQYDMRFNRGFFIDIEKNINNKKSIFYLRYFLNKKFFFREGLRGLIHSYPGFPAALIYFNQYHKTNFSIYDLDTMPLCNTFIIHRDLFERMMNWMLPYFKKTYKFGELISYLENGSKININPGHLIEAYTGLFLGLHIKMGYNPIKLKSNHDHIIKHNVIKQKVIKQI